MNVTDKLKVNNNHSIEWGDATWDEDDFSIRNRFDNSNGTFNKAGSSEIPWYDFNLMILESIKRGHFSKAELSDILKEISDRIKTL